MKGSHRARARRPGPFSAAWARCGAARRRLRWRPGIAASASIRRRLSPRRSPPAAAAAHNAWPAPPAWRRSCPRRIEPRTRRASSPAVTSSPQKKTMISGEAKLGLSLTAVPGSMTDQSRARAEADEGDKQADARRRCRSDAGADRHRRAPRATPTAKGQKQHAGNEDRAQSHLPGRWRICPAATCGDHRAAAEWPRRRRRSSRPCPAPGRSDSGHTEPHDRVARAAERQVAVVTAPKSMPVGLPNIAPERTAGWTNDDVSHGEESGRAGQQFNLARWSGSLKGERVVRAWRLKAAI